MHHNTVALPHQQHGDRWGFEHALALLDGVALMRRQHAARRCTLVDIGAHHGTVALAALEAGCRVWAFEVNERHLSVLRRNVAAYNESSISIHTTEPADVVVPAWVRPTLLKVDVDGAELHVLGGARGVLNRSLAVSFELSLIYGRRDGRLGYTLGATATDARANALAYLQAFRGAGFTLYTHWYKPRPHRRGPATSLPMDEWGARGAPPPPNASHPMRALVLSCGRSAAHALEDDAALVDAMLGPRLVDEMDLWGVRRDLCPQVTVSYR